MRASDDGAQQYGPECTAADASNFIQQVIDHLTKLAPLERLGTPQDIANAIAFLVSPAAAWINGQTVRANGGIV